MPLCRRHELVVKHILVVDDDPAMLKLLSRVISAANYRVTTAPGGLAAIAAIAADSIDLLVTDYRMPAMNGRELIIALRAHRPGLKTLVVTGFPPSDGEDQEWWAEQPCLSKPFSVKALQDAVVALIGPSRP